MVIDIAMVACGARRRAEEVATSVRSAILSIPANNNNSINSRPVVSLNFHLIHRQGDENDEFWNNVLGNWQNTAFMGNKCFVFIL
jgi:hypothetical protein